jgi:hypothetical protein
MEAVSDGQRNGNDPSPLEKTCTAARCLGDGPEIVRYLIDTILCPCPMEPAFVALCRMPS